MIKSTECAALAERLLEGKVIPYVLGGETIKGMDCQGLIEYVIRQLGGKVSYRGSNDMFRNACTRVALLSNEKPEPGCVLFIVRKDGNEPPFYKLDGLGNASHVGWYTGGEHEVVHASSSKGKVTSSTLKNGWTHVGWLKNIVYREGIMPDSFLLRRRDKGDKVKALQEGLLKLGYDLGEADGDFGSKTEAAVTHFQIDNGCTVDGVWNAECQMKLEQRLATSPSYNREISFLQDLQDAIAARLNELTT